MTDLEAFNAIMDTLKEFDEQDRTRLMAAAITFYGIEENVVEVLRR